MNQRERVEKRDQLTSEAKDLLDQIRNTVGIVGTMAKQDVTDRWLEVLENTVKGLRQTQEHC